MARSKRPLSIPLFPQDFIGSADVLAMTYEQVGCYIFLLCIAWQGEPPCTIPNDEKLQANLLKIPLTKWRKISTGVLVPWTDIGDGKLCQERLFREYEYLTNKAEKASNAGVSGGKASAEKRRLAAAKKTNDRSTVVQRSLNSASSESQPPYPYPYPIVKQSPPPPAREAGPSLSGIELDGNQQAAADLVFVAAVGVLRPPGNAGEGWVLPLHEAQALSSVIDATMVSKTALIDGIERHPHEMAEEIAAVVRTSTPVNCRALCKFIESIWKRCQLNKCKPGDPHKSKKLSVQHEEAPTKGAWDFE